MTTTQCRSGSTTSNTKQFHVHKVIVWRALSRSLDTQVHKSESEGTVSFRVGISEFRNDRRLWRSCENVPVTKAYNRRHCDLESCGL